MLQEPEAHFGFIYISEHRFLQQAFCSAISFSDFSSASLAVPVARLRLPSTTAFESFGFDTKFTADS